jgi:hypothetical protein
MWYAVEGKSTKESRRRTDGWLTQKPFANRCYSHRGNTIFRELVVVRLSLSVAPHTSVHICYGTANLSHNNHHVFVGCVYRFTTYRRSSMNTVVRGPRWTRAPSSTRWSRRCDSAAPTAVLSNKTRTEYGTKWAIFSPGKRPARPSEMHYTIGTNQVTYRKRSGGKRNRPK